MSDHYVKVKVQLEQMKSFGEDAEKERVDTEEQVPVSSPRAAVSPDPSSINTAGRDASRHRGKSRSKLRKDDNSSCVKHISEMSLHGSVVPAHVGKNLKRLGHDRTLHIKGTGEVLQSKSETNGNYATIHPSKSIQEARHEDGFKLGKKRRPVTVDTAKAKTSLEALKLSIKQLNWKEVRYMMRCFLLFCCLSWKNAVHAFALQVLFP